VLKYVATYLFVGIKILLMKTHQFVFVRLWFGFCGCSEVISVVEIIVRKCHMTCCHWLRVVINSMCHCEIKYFFTWVSKTDCNIWYVHARAGSALLDMDISLLMSQIHLRWKSLCAHVRQQLCSTKIRLHPFSALTHTSWLMKQDKYVFLLQFLLGFRANEYY
jgi:hypothetical protein